MRDLLDFLIGGIVGNKDFEIEESQEADRSDFEVKIDPSFFGLVIGKGGKTIKAIRNLLKVRATIEKKGVNISVTEKE
ncbi:KH domain-containing protein [Patescibacteria group bacterium]|nr:KH domain-containing protein [Patescibacteria group bacterium]MBU0777091.1 KH domain-containing protein [Patescibacteria group bacterium]MBU0845785.1 KH domain-containing protein [Patescibacteria group bacterium]MBU0922812.1 KH domain-containing protein [Patescibacteria group bacterium]MBU1066455.1 KH domain-containing protein [Patescibacteria group bacterium]